MPAPNYSIFEYRDMSDPIAQERGHVLRRNNKHYAGRNGEINLFGLHIAVVFDDITLPDLSGENLNEYGATTTRQASWHVSIDTDTVCVALPDWFTAWVQGVSGYDFNSNGLGAEIATYQTDWRKIAPWRVYRFLRHLAAWYAPRVMKYKNTITLERNRETVQYNVSRKKPAGFAYHGDLDPANRTDPGLVGPSRTNTFPIDLFFSLLYDEINIRLAWHGNVYNDTRFTYKPYVYGKRAMEIFCWGEDVLRWQQELNKVGIKTSTDKSFGPGCEASTIKFQASRGIDQDGAAGPITQAEMKKALAEMKPPKKEPEVPPTDFTDTKIPISRVGGKDRWQTNRMLLNNRGKGGARKVYVTSFDTEKTYDSDVVSSLGDGVILGASHTKMPNTSLKWLVDYKPTSVVIVGGPTSLSDTVLRQVQTEFLN